MKIKHFVQDFGIANPKDSLEPKGEDRIKYQQYVALFKKDMAKLGKLAPAGAGDLGDNEEVADSEAGVHFFLRLNHEFPDKQGIDMPFIIFGNPKGDWKILVKESLKKNKKFVARGYAKLANNGATLELTIEQGSARPKQIKKLLDKFLLKFVRKEVSFPVGVDIEAEEVTVAGNEVLQDADLDLGTDANILQNPEYDFNANVNDKISPLAVAFFKGFVLNDKVYVFENHIALTDDVKKKKKAIHNKIEVATDQWLDKIGQTLGFAKRFTLENLTGQDLSADQFYTDNHIPISANIKALMKQYKHYLTILDKLDKISYGGAEDANENALTTHTAPNILSTITADANKINATADPQIREVYLKGLWAKINDAIREKILAGADEANLKVLRKEIADKFLGEAALKKAVAADPVLPPVFDVAQITADDLTKLDTAGNLSSRVSPSGNAFKKIVALIRSMQGEANGAKKIAMMREIEQKINEWLLKHQTDSDSEQVQQMAALRGFQKNVLPKVLNPAAVVEAPDAFIAKVNLNKALLEQNIKAFDKLNSKLEPSFKKIYEALKAFQKAPSKELLQHVVRLMEHWTTKNPKDKKRREFLQSLQNGLIKNLLGDEVQDMKIGNDTFATDSTKLFDDAIAGSTESSEKAKAVRDAKVSERARRLAELLKLGKAKKSDKLFGAVAKWLADSFDNKLEDEYNIACQQINNGQSSSLPADILSVFGVGNLQSRYLLDRLRGITHSLAPLAMKLGIMGNDAFINNLAGRIALDIVTLGTLELGMAIPSALAGNEEPADAMEEVLKHLSATEINSILNAPPSDATYEGAINKKITGKVLGMERFKKQMETKKDILELKAKDPVPEQELNAANQNYMCSMVERLKKEHLSAEEGKLKKLWNKMTGRVNPDKLIQETLAWAEKASESEKAALLDPNGPFMLELEEMAKATKVSGFQQSHLAYLKKRLAAPKRNENSEMAEKLFDELDALSDQQHERTALSRRSNKDVVYENFKAVTKLENGNPQLALVKRFAIDHLDEWNELTAQLASGTITEEGRAAALKRQGEILNIAMQGLRGMMGNAQVSSDRQMKIEEAVFSNGARGFIYQKLANLATGRPRYDIGAQILELLNGVPTSSAEFATIKNDKKLLAALKKRTLGKLNTEDNQTKWRDICKILGVKNEDVPIGDGTVSEFETHRKDVSKARHKLIDPEELKKQKVEAAKQEKTAEFWAAKISQEYRSTNNEQHLLMLFYKAQQKGVSGADIFTQLGGGANIEALDKDAHKRLLKETSDHAIPLFKKLSEGGKITAKEIMGDTVASVGVTNQNKAWLAVRNIFRTTDEGEVKTLVKTMSAAEVLEYFFDFKPLKELAGQKGIQEAIISNVAASLPEKTRAQEEIKALNVKIQSFLSRCDISKDVMLELDAMMKPKHALEVKKIIRFKLGNELQAEGPNDTKKVFKDMGFSDEDIRLLGLDIKAISNIETAKQSETGLQWSSVSSRMVQRDIAEAEYLTKGWENKDRLKQIGTLSAEDIKAEKLQMIESFAEAETLLKEAVQQFEERKGQYDQQLKDFISTLMAAIIAGVSIASGAGAALGIVQLMWAMFTPVVKNLISQVVKRATDGDRGDAVTFKEHLSEWFFNTLADEAGTAMGFIGANLAFALDVKAIGVLMPSGAKNSGWTAWDNILKSPFLKTAKSYISGTFDNIGRSFVETWTKKTKGSSATSAVAELENFGKNTVVKLGKSYLKALVLTTFTTGANELATKLGWDSAKWHHTGGASGNLNTTGEPRAFNSDDARFMDVAKFNENKEQQGVFTSFVNSLGMFDASPKLLGSGNYATSDLSAPWEFIKIPAVAIQNLSDPKYLNTVVNNFVWGSSEFKGGGIGISHVIAGMVDSAIGAFQPQKPKTGATDEYTKAQKAFEQKREELAKRLEKELTDEIRVQLGTKKNEIIAVIQEWATNLVDPKVIPNFPALTVPIVTAWDALNNAKDIMNVWKNMEFMDTPANLLTIKDHAKKELGLDANQFDLFYAKVCNALNPKSSEDIIQKYYTEQANIEAALMNAKFVKAYTAARFADDGVNFENGKFKIPAAVTGASDLFIPLDKNIPALTLPELYEQWEKWSKAKGQPVKYDVVTFLKDAAIHGNALDDAMVNSYMTIMFVKSEEEKIKYFSDNAAAVKIALSNAAFRAALENEEAISEIMGDDVLKTFKKYEFWKSNTDGLADIKSKGAANLQLAHFKLYLTNDNGGNPKGDGISPLAADAFIELQDKLGRKDEALFKYYFDSRSTISAMLKDGNFGTPYLKSIIDGVTDGRYREILPLYNDFKVL